MIFELTQNMKIGKKLKEICIDASGLKKTRLSLLI